MNMSHVFYKKEAAACLHANDYAQLLTLAGRVKFERSLVEDLLSPNLRHRKKAAEARTELLTFFDEDVQRGLSQHEQRMLDNFARLVNHNRWEDSFNGQDL